MVQVVRVRRTTRHLEVDRQEIARWYGVQQRARCCARAAGDHPARCSHLRVQCLDQGRARRRNASGNDQHVGLRGSQVIPATVIARKCIRGGCQLQCRHTTAAKVEHKWPEPGRDLRPPSRMPGGRTQTRQPWHRRPHATLPALCPRARGAGRPTAGQRSTGRAAGPQGQS